MSRARVKRGQKVSEAHPQCSRLAHKGHPGQDVALDRGLARGHSLGS